MSITEIMYQYMYCVHLMQLVHLELLMKYLVIVAMLAEIKSCMLLFCLDILKI
uniref:hypothetical protein n=1 Tax=Candidatus Pseudomonas adelgestsugas TaxID=1302376 RepID=UPI00100DC3CC|nr:hypothetical protein [Candidatus Pseudomonas adelgestsugas]